MTNLLTRKQLYDHPDINEWAKKHVTHIVNAAAGDNDQARTQALRQYTLTQFQKADLRKKLRQDKDAAAFLEGWDACSDFYGFTQHQK